MSARNGRGRFWPKPHFFDGAAFRGKNASHDGVSDPGSVDGGRRRARGRAAPKEAPRARRRARPARGRGRLGRPADRRAVGREPAADGPGRAPELRLARSQDDRRRRPRLPSAGLRPRSRRSRSTWAASSGSSPRRARRSRSCASSGLREALELWRGRALAEFDYAPFAQIEGTRWTSYASRPRRTWSRHGSRSAATPTSSPSSKP